MYIEIERHTLNKAMPYNYFQLAKALNLQTSQYKVDTATSLPGNMERFLKIGSPNWDNIDDETITCVKHLHNY